jgi:NADPH-dependent curcumin reductase CurA
LQLRSVGRRGFVLTYLLFVSLAVVTPVGVGLFAVHSLRAPEMALVGAVAGAIGAVVYRRSRPPVAAALGCGALTAVALYCVYLVVAIALVLHEGFDLPNQ